MQNLLNCSLNIKHLPTEIVRLRYFKDKVAYLFNFSCERKKKCVTRLDLHRKNFNYQLLIIIRVCFTVKIPTILSLNVFLITYRI